MITLKFVGKNKIIIYKLKQNNPSHNIIFVTLINKNNLREKVVLEYYIKLSLKEATHQIKKMISDEFKLEYIK